MRFIDRMTADKRRAPDVDAGELVALGLGKREAAELARLLSEALRIEDPLLRWRFVSKRLLEPHHPHEIHRLAFERAYADWDAARGPAPAWVPGESEIRASNLGAVMAGDYPSYHRASVDEPEAYWSAMLERLGIAADEAPGEIVDLSRGAERARWLPGMRLNIASAALERDPDRIAVVWQAESGSLHEVALGELKRDALAVADALAALGLSPGDAVAIDMPMSYPSVAIYLGIVAFGGVVVAIADSFAPPEIATRLRIGEARLVFTQDVILRGGKRLPLYEKVTAAKRELGRDVAVVVVAAEAGASARLGPGDQAYTAFLRAGKATRRAAPYHVSAIDDATNVLFSSGTTGDPKAIVWTHLTPIKAAADAWGHHDVHAGDVLAWPTNLGWMMGPWLIYASLLNDATIALYQGSPLERGFGEFVTRAGVTLLGVVPSLVRSWRESSAMEGLDWTLVRCFSSTGEASTPDDMLWLMARAGYKPVIEYCGGTEIGGGYISGTVVQPQAPSAFSTPALGCSFYLLDEQGRAGDEGELALVAPLFGSSSTLLNADHHAVYFAGMPRGPRGEVLRRHGDAMQALGGGYYRAQGRIDDTMNLGGIKISSAEIERVLNGVEGVFETAAVGVPPSGGGPDRLVIYAVVRPEAERDGLQAAMTAAIREALNPLFKIHAVVVVDSLPRTASNKVMRRVLRDRERDR
jgi:acetyl-CoA synthetase